MYKQTITRQQVIDLALTMPLEKLTSWYDYGLFIWERPLSQVIETSNTAQLTTNTSLAMDSDLADEFSDWEAASDENWVAFEKELEEMT